jgi:hypothetical protein
MVQPLIKSHQSMQQLFFRMILNYLTKPFFLPAEIPAPDGKLCAAGWARTAVSQTSENLES